MNGTSSLSVRAPFTKLLTTQDNYVESNTFDFGFIPVGIIILNIGTNNAKVSFFDEKVNDWVEAEPPIRSNQSYTFEGIRVQKIRFKSALAGNPTSIELWAW